MEDNITFITGDLFDTKANVILHQVNCQGVMGSGIAAEVKRRFPKAYNSYKELCLMTPKELLLGQAQIVNCSDLFVVNMFSQYNYGYNGKRYTDYEAFYRCLEEVNKSFIPELSFALPYNIGCDRGGANWNIIFTMIKEVFQKRKIFIYKLEN